jgi:hypothetical protein
MQRKIGLIDPNSIKYNNPETNNPETNNPEPNNPEPNNPETPESRIRRIEAVDLSGKPGYTNGKYKLANDVALYNKRKSIKSGYWYQSSVTLTRNGNTYEYRRAKWYSNWIFIVLKNDVFYKGIVVTNRVYRGQVLFLDPIVKFLADHKILLATREITRHRIKGFKFTSVRLAS